MGQTTTYTATTDWSGPTAALALSLVLAFAAILVVHWGIGAHRRGMARVRAAEAREAARAAGHPAGADRGVDRLTVAQRRKVAAEVAGILVDAGFRLERDLLDTDTMVRAWGMDGVYVADAGPNYVAVGYQTNHATVGLGRYLGTLHAAQAITVHAGRDRSAA